MKIASFLYIQVYLKGVIQITDYNKQLAADADMMARCKKQYDRVKTSTANYQKVLKTKSPAATKYNAKMNSLNKQITAVKFQMNYIKKSKTRWNTKGLLYAGNKKLKELEKKYNRAKTNYSKAVGKVNKTDRHRAKTLTNLKNSDKFNKCAYIMPNYPKTDSSYVFIFMQDISGSHGNTPATKAVDHGMNFAATTQMNTPTVSISGTLGGDVDTTLEEILKDVAKLELWADKGSDLRWVGKRQANHVILSDLQTDINTASGGTGVNTVSVSGTLTLASYFNSNVKKKKSKTSNTGTKSTKKGTKKDTKNYGANGDINDYYANKANAKSHKYVIAKRGYTYWYVAQKKGVKLSVIEKLNNYKDRQIPIGSKIYYS